MTEPQFRIKDATGTISVYTRNHINGCKLADQNQNNCQCPKWIYANRKGETPRRFAAETPSFAQACETAKYTHDGWHPEIERARAAQVKLERGKVHIVTIVADFIADTDGTESTAEQLKSILGCVSEEGKVRGHFLTWVNEHNIGLKAEERLDYIHQLDTALLGTFKTWLMKRFKSDASRAQRWGTVRSLFRWASERGLTDRNIAQPIKAPKRKKGNRCGAFTDQQYRDILAAVPRYAATCKLSATAEHRLTMFIEVLRYAGMAIVDAVLFSPFVDTHGLGLGYDGVLRYRRRKTNQLAVIPVENEGLIASIRAGIPLEANSDPRRPFATKGLRLESKLAIDWATRQWAAPLDEVYKLAGIHTISTEIGERAPHAHMFRDTFAKWHLDRGTDIRDLQKMLGHASVMTTELSYSSWLKDDQQRMIDRIRARPVVESGVLTMPSKKEA